jgi:hypothetical protein
MHDRQSSCLRGIVLKLHGVYSRSGPRSRSCINLGIWIAAANKNAPLAIYSPVFACPLIDLSEPETVHAADFTGCEALVHARFVDYLLGSYQQCRRFSSLELPY